MKHRNEIHRAIRKGKFWRRRLHSNTPLDWYEDFARRWQQLEKKVIPVMKALVERWTNALDA
jgi:hypothetical protein